MTNHNGTQFPVLAGTEGTSEYVTLLVTALGILALRRDVDRHSYRLRVEPTNAGATKKMAPTLTRAADWKQPGDSGQNRFSNVCDITDDATLRELASTAAGAMLNGGDGGTVSADAPAHLRDMLLALPGVTVPAETTTVEHPAVEHQSLVAAVQGAKVAGANSARNWGLPALRAKKPTA